MSPEPNYTQWQKLYSKADSYWADLTRMGQVWMPILGLLFLATMYVVAGFLAFHLEEWVIRQEKIIYFRLILTILAPTLVTGVGLVLIFKATASYFRSLYKLPLDQKLGPIIRRRLLGIPPLPPPLNQAIKYPFVVLREPFLEDDHWSRLVGGPATLVVYDGVSLYLERGNQFSRVVGPGMPFLERYERIKEVVDLKPQMKTQEIKPWTKDGIRIALTIMAECQISACHKAQAESHHLQYPFDPCAVRNAVDGMTVRVSEGKLCEASWLDGAWGTITGAINAYVAKHSLDELFLAPQSPLPSIAAYSGMIAQLLSEKFSTALLGQINSSLARYGSTAINIQVTKIEVPSSVLALRIKYWECERKIISARKISKAEADGIRVRQQAFALAQRSMLETITQKLEKLDPDNLTQPLILSLSGLLDQGLNDPIVRPLLAKESFAALQKLKQLLDQEF
jgi:hypothetical protein